jgi:hypothetical protein
VTGFSVTKGERMMERTFNVMGHGTVLGAASVPHGTPEAIEKWFRSHPHFGAGGPQTVAQPAAAISAPAPSLVADELRKLADLRREGILSNVGCPSARSGR